MSASLLVPASHATPAIPHLPGGNATHLRATLNGMTAGIVTLDAVLRPVFCNASLAGTLGIAPPIVHAAASVLDLLEGSVLDDDAVQRVHELCLRFTAEGPEDQDTVDVTAARSSRRFAVTVARLGDGCVSASFQDITLSRLAEANAIERAMCDPLTGLADRRQFIVKLAEALDEGHREPTEVGLSVFLVDLDRFKSVNDTLGHQIGDGLLRLVSKRLRSVIRAHDVLARLGGDEFAVLVSPAPDELSLFGLARRIVDVLGRPYLIDSHLVTIGASLGIARAPVDGHEQGLLMRNADLALYEAKSAGRGQFACFKPELDKRALARRSLEIDLRRALVMREFELHYQPQIDLESGAAVGFEALLRWRHSERGLVSPADFIPVAEEIGLIVSLGEWVLREACQQAARWPDHVSVAVNVSPAQFEDTGRLVKAITQALASSGLDGSRLEIEITESVLFRNEEVVLEALNRVRALGVRIAMDDFGTGYSSLSQLHSFPFDKIKIDRSFVKDRGDVESQNAIIRAITALGVSLGMSTIAEGVETSDQLARIRAGGCGSVQGYLFSKPVPIDQVDQLIAAFDSERQKPSIASEPGKMP